MALTAAKVKDLEDKGFLALFQQMSCGGRKRTRHTPTPEAW